MKRFPLILAFAVLLCASMWAQDAVVTSTSYSFQDVNYPNDTFTQLLGINNAGQIAGYHNVNANSGFTLVLPKSFTTENFPNSMQTQVIGINNTGQTVGFYVDQQGVTHGFFVGKPQAPASTGFPNTAFNQLLGINDRGQAVGYYSLSKNNTTPDVPYIYDLSGNVYELIIIHGALGGAQATGINNSQQVCGFYIDSKGVNHGFLLSFGSLTTLDYPGSTFTQALGLNNAGEVVGSYVDGGGANHGFVYTMKTKSFQSIDDPNGVGTTVVNGINDKHQLVGFWGTSPLNTGFVADPQ
jgi:uncharacterized membrane protein